MIGRDAVPVMLAEGWDVVALTHRNAVSTPAGPGNFTARAGDVTDAEAVSSTVSEVDLVCHLAAYIPPNFQDAAEAERCLAVNAIGALHVASAAARHGKRLISCSSGQAYTYSSAPVNEDDRLYPAARATYYLASKSPASCISNTFGETPGCRQ